MAKVTDTVIERVSPRSLVDFLMETCRVAIECGCSSNRIEMLVTRLGEAWGFSVEAAALPTAVWLSVRGRGQQIIELVRVNRWGIDLNKLALLNDLVDQVENHQMNLDEAFEGLLGRTSVHLLCQRRCPRHYSWMNKTALQMQDSLASKLDLGTKFLPCF